MDVIPEASRCDCHEAHPTQDGRCPNPSLRSEGPGLESYSQCGCCMADCPDVHPSSDGSRLRARPGTMVIAQEYVDTLPAERQEQLRAAETRGDVQIRPRHEMWRPQNDV